MSDIRQLFQNNQEWSTRKVRTDPSFFQRLSRQQSPGFLWIGCSDSRVPANEIVGLDPGELFVHRNVANVVVPSDLNCLSVLQYSVEVLRVRHIIVTGHYGCGGVQAAMEAAPHGLIDSWLQPIREVHEAHSEELCRIRDHDHRHNRLCELNVASQVLNVAKTPVVQAAWQKGQALSVHGWIYSLGDGLLRDLGVTVKGFDDLPRTQRLYMTSVARSA